MNCIICDAPFERHMPRSQAVACCSPKCSHTTIPIPLEDLGMTQRIITLLPTMASYGLDARKIREEVNKYGY
jgi:hypothetical protein